MNKTKLDARHESNAALADTLARRLIPFTTKGGASVCDVACDMLSGEITSQLDRYGRFNPRRFSVSVSDSCGLSRGDQYAAMSVVGDAFDVADGMGVCGTPAQVARAILWVDSAAALWPVAEALQPSLPR